MQPDRRDFLKHLGWLAAAGSAGAASSSALAAGGHQSGPADPMGVLVDLTNCIGCRYCERACRQANGIDPGPIEAYDDPSVFEMRRRPGTDAFTVVNAWEVPDRPGRPVYAKINCMHCNHASCVSACIVGALRKKDQGAVTYDAWKCIGCRYCMIACPFQLPAYEYDKVLNPSVRKCQFCFHERTSKGELPACMEACPRQVMTYGRRSELLEMAHRQIADHPGRYVDHVYGEHEVGGTSWMYLSPVPFEQVGFPKVSSAAPPVLTEAIQHGVFKYGIAPVGIYSFLATMYWWTGRRQKMQVASRVVESDEQRNCPDALDGDEPVIEHPARDDGKHNGEHVRAEHVEHEHHARPAPVDAPLLTPGVWLLVVLATVGMGFWLYRMVMGLGATTNLDQQYPWGLWIAMDVGSGIALAGGGFVSAAIFHIFHRHRYHMLARSALLTALLGYTFYVPGLMADLGKWWNMPIVMLPPMWQVNSVLFEVGMCVMIYLTVQYLELTPIICERLLGADWPTRWPRLRRFLQATHDRLNFIMPALLVLGVTLSMFHQSSLGNLMNIAPGKLHELWWGAFSPVHFLLSAMMVALPMVIFTILFASWSLERQPEMEALSPLAGRYVPVFLTLYLLVKSGDMLWRGTWSYLIEGAYEGKLWMIEMGLGVLLPLVLFLVPAVRRSARGLTVASLLVILGVVFNRLNVFILAYQPPVESKRYVPSLTEFMVSMGLVAGLMLVYRIAVTYLPILEPRPRTQRQPAAAEDGALRQRGAMMKAEAT